MFVFVWYRLVVLVGLTLLVGIVWGVLLTRLVFDFDCWVDCFVTSLGWGCTWFVLLGLSLRVLNC